MTDESKNKRILVVEDEKSLRDVLHDKLVKEGFGVLEAKDGEEGLATALREHPDILLLDILMPKMDGLTMLEKLREDEWGKRVQVILLTNLSDIESIADATSNKVTDYLVKSDWNLENVVKKIEEKLAEH